jgi:hypothetical protein
MRKLVGSIARRTLPRPVLAAYRNFLAARLPTEEVFTRIYSQNEWGGNPGELHSGSGSGQLAAAPYVAQIRQQLASLNADQLRMVDLGCGDFRVGEQLAPACAAYVGVDIVQPLIEHHQSRFGSERVSFVHANMIEDPLPPGDICCVRQVLQHLSNAQICAVLPKLEQYRWCFITEHHPTDGRLRVKNLDKVHGRDVRVTQGSGVFLDAPPFNIPKHRYRWLFDVPGPVDLGNGDAGIIRTFLLTTSRADPTI